MNLIIIICKHARRKKGEFESYREKRGGMKKQADKTDFRGEEKKKTLGKGEKKEGRERERKKRVHPWAHLLYKRFPFEKRLKKEGKGEEGKEPILQCTLNPQPSSYKP